MTHPSAALVSASVAFARKTLKNPIIIGSLLLSAALIIMRLIGLCYKIFPSRTIGAEGLGLYQLTFSLLSLGVSLTSSGIQTALSRFVAQEQKQPRHAMRYFTGAVLLSLILCSIFGIFVHFHAAWIAVNFLGDARCQPLLQAAIICLFPSCIHACINGYYYGLKKSLIPSVSQLAEQVARVGAVYLFCAAAAERGNTIAPVHAVWGITIGECCGLLISATAMMLQNMRNTSLSSNVHKNTLRRIMGKSSMYTDDPLTLRRCLIQLAGMAFPLTFNRVVINICNSIENVLIPQCLILSGLTRSEGLSLYGVLSGMSLSVILFPGVLTGSLSVLLLPSVAEAAAARESQRIAAIIRKSIFFGLIFGFFFTGLFLLSGDFIGTQLFGSAVAGEYIRRLSFICPFVYLANLLGSVLHGLGRPRTVLFVNLLSCLIRIAFIRLLVPSYGIDAYLWSMLISQLFCAVGSIAALWGDYETRPTAST